MTRTDQVGSRVFVATLCLSVCLSIPLLAQRADRAVISGVVTDAQGAAMPGATVTIHNEATGVDTVIVTNNAGAYTSPPLVLGQYSVTVDMQGFKKAVTSGILLQGGEAIRNDVAMQVGALQETVQVTGRSGIDVTTPDVAHTVNEEYYRALPIVTAADVRLAEAVLQIQPGYLPMRPNGDPMFRGSQFNSRINGGQTMATENFFDGAAFGYAVGHQQSHESTPPVEAVQEVKVITTSLFGPVRPHQRRLHRVHRRSPARTSIAAASTTTLPTTSSTRPGSSRSRPAPDVPAQQQQLRRHVRRSGEAAGIRRPQQDVLLRQLRLHQTSFRRAAGLRQHDANRRVQERRFQRAADGQSDRRRRAGAPDLRGADFQPGNDPSGQRHPGPRSLSGQHHSGQRPDAEPGGVARRPP